MNKFHLHMLEYESVRTELMRYAVSYEGRQRINELGPMEDKRAIERAIAETKEGYQLLKKGSSVPLPALEGIETVMSLIGTGYLFTEQDLTAIQRFLQSCGQLKKYMASKGGLVERIGYYALSLEELPNLQKEILRCIYNGVISDQASRELEKIRRRMSMVKDKIVKRLQSIMSRHSSILQEHLVSIRGGRYVIPVKREFYRQISGSMLDQSTSGQTVFIEPKEISGLQSELDGLQGDEVREENKILGYLAQLVEREASYLRQNIEIMGTYDFILAKAKYGATMNGVAVGLSQGRETIITGAKHPLLLNHMVPLDLSIGADYNNLIITGPNTGGKTVVLKTFGLLALMVQSGLLVPVDEGSRFAVYSGIMAVIGDGQNLEQSLSTFSAQIQSIVQMLQDAGSTTLMLIDELAAGTDPGEGIALSIAILEEFHAKGATTLVTTHYSELKTFANRTRGFQNARMEFHAETLRPLYRLTIGEAGQSYGIEIARKLGITEGVIARSKEIAASQTSHKGMLHVFDDILPPQREETDACAQAANDTDTKADAVEAVMPSPSEKVIRERLEVGDSVFITSFQKYGIVSAVEDNRGIVEVQIQKQRVKVNQKRVQLHIKKEEFYPDDYDMDIVFDSKENRKKRKLMSKGHVDGVEIVIKPKEN